MKNPTSVPANEASPTKPTTTDNQSNESTIRHHLKTTSTQVHSRIVSLSVGLAFLLFVAVTPAAAASNLGSVYCGTGVETGLDYIFGAIAGLGLPAVAIYGGNAGLHYMHAGGNPEKKNNAKEKLVMAATGFGIIIFAILVPELAQKVAAEMGIYFSDCVTPL